MDVTRHKPSLHGFVVLVVDDDPVGLETASTLIADEFGCLVLCAASAEEALRLIDSGLHVDLVFSDVVMPKIDGVLLARTIRKRKRRLPVVLTTGRADFIHSIVHRGAIALIKPYSIQRLQAIFTERLCPSALDTVASPTLARDRRSVKSL